MTGTLHVDDGARRAVAGRSRSLLAVGVVDCEGRFEAGDAVELVGPTGWRSLEAWRRPRRESREAAAWSGEAVHRDRLVVD